MATIRDLLQDELVIEEIKATDKLGVIREFSRLLKSAGRIENEDELVRVLLERESLGSTAVGDGVAIPHAKLHFLPEMIIAFGRSSRGIDFQSIDEKPVYLVFLLVTPDDRPGEHLKALARISRILKNPVLRENLKRSSQGKQLQMFICDEDSKYPEPQGTQRT
jgi:PTS system nitrogen regulatory IIA component